MAGTDISGVVEHLMPGIRRPRPDPNGRPPTDAELDVLLHAAVSVPDHGLLRPWRFVVISGEARDRFGDALASDAAVVDDTPAMTDRARRKAFASPMHVLVLASPRESNIPEWEQEASAACCGYAMILAATALGLGAVWKSTSLRDGDALRHLLAADEHERVLGWIGLGSPADSAESRPRSDPGLEMPVTVLPAGPALVH